MVAPTFDVSAGNRVAAAHSSRPSGERLRYRLQVVAAGAADIVESAGGWLYDRVMAGWEVTALLPPGADTRPLRILGVTVCDQRSGLGEASAASQSLAVSAEAFTADEEVRRRVLACLEDRLTEVALWGDGWPLGVHRATAEAQHLLSAAARRFKRHALAAAGIPDALIAPTETLLRDAHSRIG
ncbi:hypothetical protein BN971_04336 [Mycobacterium bohemicum DSM 44277]|uniref:Uncharacterized protein n=2 Tax=Mycobacterium bohemicum TaxID=56425 RepID=A0A1X1RAR0_MYCBE|nr:hypothetical protein [Mycobacterium bohemicum]MCV6968677.1 hypothetical protein [Mycobacterium bohemicum]ORV02136.1 hypothetical protein AWB93_04665 [Mycobacterium bohemicum]CPR13029.1 hypothetical protein BN971_04336 [Mycobacterium bohemicum DSM 44277]